MAAGLITPLTALNVAAGAAALAVAIVCCIIGQILGLLSEVGHSKNHQALVEQVEDVDAQIEAAESLDHNNNQDLKDDIQEKIEL